MKKPLLLVRSATVQDLTVSPIFPDWIVDGKPEAKVLDLGRGTDQTAQMFVWECSAGEFDWHYDCDETCVFVAGETYLTPADDSEQVMRAGDTAHFPAGSMCRWRVPVRVRKVAILRPVLPLPLSLTARAWGRFRGLFVPPRGL